MTAPLLDGLREAAPRFEAFLLDQFGVLHDGTAAYPGVVDCLTALKAAGKRVIVLSNSGSLEAANIERLARLGIAEELYEAIATSGEVARDYLGALPAELRAEGADGGPLRCLPLGGPAERTLLEGLPIGIAESVEAADFLLLASFGRTPPPRDAFDEIFRAALRRGLTLVCANPDVRGVTPDGLILAPGALAADYQAEGGRVTYIGKPHPLIYRQVLKKLAPTPAIKVLAVGDSLAHDIAGAQGAGIASALIVEGIHHWELGDPAEEAFAGRLAELQQRHGATSDYILPRLAW